MVFGTSYAALGFVYCATEPVPLPAISDDLSRIAAMASRCIDGSITSHLAETPLRPASPGLMPPVRIRYASNPGPLSGVRDAQ